MSLFMTPAVQRYHCVNHKKDAEMFPNSQLISHNCVFVCGQVKHCWNNHVNYSNTQRHEHKILIILFNQSNTSGLYHNINMGILILQSESDPRKPQR